MDALFSKVTGGGGGGGDDKKDGSSEKPSSFELFSSAKVVAEAGQAAFSNKSAEVDKPKVAAAAEDLLKAAEEYGKLDEKGYGTYVDKAEQYLKSYSASTTTTTVAAADAPAPKKEVKEEKKIEEGSGGVGDVMKLAGGFFK